MQLKNKEQYKELITDWLNDLPLELLVQVIDYVYLLRYKALLPEQFEADIESELINFEGRKLSRESEAHLLEEVESDYKK